MHSCFCEYILCLVNKLEHKHSGFWAKLCVLLDGQAEKVTAHGPEEKDLATERKQAKKKVAEVQKKEAYEYNAASKQAAKEAAQNKQEKGGAI